MDSSGNTASRGWRVVLVFSLALNLLIIGALVGTSLSGRGKDNAPQRVSFEFGPLGRALDKQDRRAIGQAMRRDGARVPSRDAMKQRAGELAAALRADPFDPDQVSALMSVLQDRSRSVTASAQTAFVAHLVAMTPEKRAALADRLEKQ